jgi:hypothetical protein
VSEFPTVIECEPDETFMRDSFSFEYSDPEMRVDRCGHPCYGTDCGHTGCCQRTEEIEMVCFVSCIFEFIYFLCI